MVRFITIFILGFFSLNASATVYYSVNTGLWNDGNNWSLISAGTPVGGAVVADNNTFIIQDGDVIDFSNYNPSAVASNNKIVVEEGEVNSTTVLGNANFELEVYADGTVSTSADLYPDYTKLSVSASITVAGDFSSTYLSSDSYTAASASISAQNVYFQFYNNYKNNAGTVGNSLTVDITLVGSGGVVEIDNYDDVAGASLNITNGDLQFDDASATINGEIIVDGNLLLPSTFNYTVNGRLESDFSTNYSFDHNSRVIYIEDDGVVELTGDGSTVVTHSDNLLMKGFMVKEGGKLILHEMDYEQKGYNSYTIEGVFSMQNGSFHQYAGDVIIAQSGSLLLQDNDQPIDAVDIDAGIYNMYWGGKVLNNYGMFLAEKYETHNSGSNHFNNYEVMFIKSFVTDHNANSLNVYDANTSGDAAIDNVDYLRETTLPPPTYYSGSYLYYCTEDNDLDHIKKDSDASIFMPIGADAVAGSIPLFPDVQSCFDEFYGEISDVLPVELADFSAVVDNGAVKLEWVTASEKDNSYFSVLKSENGVDFEVIGEVAGGGTVSTASEYSFVDDNPKKGTNYYKIVQTDFDGGENAFPVVSVHYDDDASVSVFPTVTSPGDYVSIQLSEYEGVRATLLNSEGTELAAGESVDEKSYFLLPYDLKAGKYYLKLVVNNEVFVEQVIVK